MPQGAGRRPVGRPPVDAAALRARVFDAALDLCATHGYDGVRVTQIIEASGVSAGTFYRHFGSKDAVLTELVDELTQRMADAIAERRTPRDDPVDDLHDWVSTVVEVGQRTLGDWVPQLRRVVQTALPPALEQGRALHEAVSHELAVPIIARGVAEGRFRSVEPAATVRLITAVLDRAIIDGHPTPTECSEFVVRAVLPEPDPPLPRPTSEER